MTTNNINNTINTNTNVNNFSINSSVGSFECIQEQKNPEDIKLYYDYDNKCIITSAYLETEECNNRYEEVDIPMNASLACTTCKYHSLNGCTNVKLAYDYYSAFEKEKDNILNGEFCRYYNEQTKN